MKMKSFDSIVRMDDSSAFGPRRTSFRFPSTPFPAEQIVPIVTILLRFLCPFFLGAINFSSLPSLLCCSLEEREPRSATADPRPRGVYIGNGRRCAAAVVDPGCLSRLVNTTTRNKGLRHNKTRCLRIVRFTFRHQESSATAETLVMLCKI